MGTTKRTLLVLAVFAAMLTAASTAWGAYWFFQGNLINTVLKDRDSTGTQYVRMSFDNTNHPGHIQYIALIRSGGSWDTITQSCSSGYSGCDSGSLAVSGLYYPKGGCENPQSYQVWTNCKYGTGP
jgi:hypothetical protein